ncbi:MAG: hypothetical protein ACREMB_28425 [Candidatus Rokuibacteriota bacterium]
MASTRAPLARPETASGARVYRIPVETFPGPVEHLFQRGELGIANLRDVESEPNPVIRYERRRNG